MNNPTCEDCGHPGTPDNSLCQKYRQWFKGGKAGWLCVKCNFDRTKFYISDQYESTTHVAIPRDTWEKVRNVLEQFSDEPMVQDCLELLKKEGLV